MNELQILRTMIDSFPDGIFLKDRESRFLFANQVIADLMQVPEPAALIGKTDHDFYPKVVADALLAEEILLFKTLRPLVNKEELRSPARGPRRILITKAPVMDAEGKVTGLLGITRDITEGQQEGTSRITKGSGEVLRAVLRVF